MNIILEVILCIVVGFVFGFIATEPMHAKKTEFFQVCTGIIFAIFFGVVAYLSFS